MSLVTPEFGLFFWMVVVFGIVFFVLAKFGFPVITSMVQKRSDHIEDSLRKAEEAQARLDHLAEEQARLLEETRREQSRMIKAASDARDKIIAKAKDQAQEEANKLIEHARTEIAAEKESALRDINRQVSMIAVEIAEKILRKELEQTPEQLALVERLTKEVSKAKIKRN